jgi:hypothetical protein
MFNDSTRQSYDYEIVISKSKGKYTAYSHTWYIIDNKRYYGIKKINVRIAKDGKIVMQDATLVDNNYPIPAYKSVIQLNVLDLASISNETMLKGEFVTNRSKYFKELTGRISVQKSNPLLVQSDLMQYLQKNSMDGFITALK